VIRAATNDDLYAVYGLMRQLSRYPFTKEQFESCYLHNLENNYILVREQNKHVDACGVLSIRFPLHFSCKTAEIINLIVDEGARNQGIGKQLLVSFEAIAVASGCVCIVVNSGKQREAAHRFYEREGYVYTHYRFTKEFS